MVQWYAGAVLAAVAGALVQALSGNWSEGENALLAMGRLLRELSLSGAAGDIAAWAVYIVLCALPLALLLPRGRKRSRADWAFVLAAVYSLWMWRMLANPSRMIPDYMPALENVYALMAGGVLLSLLLGGVLMRALAEKETARMLKTAGGALGAAMLLAGFSAGMGVAGQMMAMENSADVSLGVIACACVLIESAALLAMLGAAAELLGGMQKGWFDAENAEKADKLAVRSRALLIISIVCSLCSNLAALVFAGRATQSSVHVDIPLVKLIAAVSCALLARFIREGVRIKTENDEFV